MQFMVPCKEKERRETSGKVWKWVIWTRILNLEFYHYSTESFLLFHGVQR